MAEQTPKHMPGAGMKLDPPERQLIAGMPLHAITSVHGEAGLRELCAQAPRLTLDELLEQIKTTALEHAAGRPRDDIALLAVRLSVD